MCEYKVIIQNEIENLNQTDIYLLFGKKERRNDETRYSFFEGQTQNEDIRTAMLNILIDNFNNLIDSNIINQFDENDDESYIFFNLEAINTWNAFEPYVYMQIENFKEIPENEIGNYNKDPQQITALESLKRNLNHYVITNETEEYIFGQITRIMPKQILINDSQLIFEEEIFTEIKEESGIKFNPISSILFFINDEFKIGFIKNYKDFQDIFDMNQQYLETALNTINDSEFSNYCDFNYEDIINHDRNIQKMLNKELTQYGFENFDLDNINRAYENLTNDMGNLPFNFDGETFEIDENNQKESFKSMIKFIGYYYNQSLDGEHIIEGTPRNFIND